MMNYIFALLLALPMPALAEVPAQAGTSPFWGLLQVMLALLIVLAVIVGLAWGVKRIGMGRVLGRWQVAKVVSGVMVGPSERVVVVELEGQWLVLGVTSHQVNLLTTMAKPDQPSGQAEATEMPQFAQRLAALLRQGHDKTGGKE